MIMKAVHVLTLLICCQRVLCSPLFSTKPKQYIPTVLSRSYEQINTIQEDISRPGILLAIQGYALVEITVNKTINVIAGSVKRKGNRINRFSKTRFGTIHSFLQREEDNSLLLVDQDNNCIRSVNITSETTSVFSGLCGTKDQSHNGTLVEARYWNPYDIASIPNSSRILLTERDKVRVIDTDTGRVDTVHSGGAYFRRIAVTKDGSSVFITTLGGGIYEFDNSLKLRTNFQPESWSSSMEDLYSPTFGRKRRDYNLNNWKSPAFDLSLDFGLGEFPDFSGKQTTPPVFGFKTLSNFAGIALITDNVALVSTGNALTDNGLYLVDLVKHVATKMCVSSSDNFKLAQCLYSNKASDLRIINSTLFTTGHSTNIWDHSGSLEYITLNDQCEVNGSSAYPLSTGISLENGTTVVCDIDTETSDVRWISSRKGNGTDVNSSASNITDYESEQKEQDKPEVTVSLTTTTADITTVYKKTPQSTPAIQDDNAITTSSTTTSDRASMYNTPKSTPETQDDNAITIDGTISVEITIVIIVTLVIFVGSSIINKVKNNTPASSENPDQEDFQSETYDTIDQLDYHLYDEISNNHRPGVPPSSDQSGIQIRPLPDPLKEQSYSDQEVQIEGEYVIVPEMEECDTQPEPQYVINAQHIYASQL